MLLDESIFPVAPYLTYGWFPIGSHPSIRYEHNRKDKHFVLGALNTEYFIYEITEELNSDVFQRFVRRLITHFNKLVIVVDHASYHVSKDTQRFFEEYKNQLHVEYFPSYSPELNPVEQIWRAVKKWLAMRYWTNKDELKKQLVSAFKEDFVRVPIYGYLLP